LGRPLASSIEISIHLPDAVGVSLKTTGAFVAPSELVELIDTSLTTFGLQTGTSLAVCGFCLTSLVFVLD